MFGNVQLTDILNLLPGATILVSYLKAYETMQTDEFHSTTPTKSNTQNIPLKRIFTIKHANATLLRKCVETFLKIDQQRNDEIIFLGCFEYLLSTNH